MVIIMKKKFEKPSIEITEIECSDVIAISNELFSNGVNVGGVLEENIATDIKTFNATEF